MQVISLGLGNRGAQWVKWAREAGAEIVAVVDRHVPTLSDVGERLGFKESERFASLESAVKSTGCRVVIACAPNHIHEAIVSECVELGCHVLIEKPFTEDMASAKSLTERAEERGLCVAVAQQYRYGKGFERVQRVVKEQLGDVTSGLVQFYRWRPTEGIKLPLLLNQGVHQLDCIRYVVGSDPVSCRADLWDPEWNGCDGPTVAEATFRFRDGARIHYSGSYVARGRVTNYNGLWRIEGERGQVTYDGEAAVHVSLGDELTEYTETDPSGAYRQVALCRNFLEAIASGAPAPTSAADNLKTMAMVFMIEASARLGREVHLDEVLNGQI